MKKSEPIKEHDSLYPKILEIMQFNEISATKFRTFNERPQRAADYVSGRFRMKEDEKILFITEISELRNLLMKAFTKLDDTTIQKIMDDKRFKHSKFISKIIRSRLSQRKLNLMQNTKLFQNNKEKEELKTILILLYNRLLLVPNQK